jgi:hypothetical protein
MGADAQPIRVSVVASTSTPDHLELPRRPLKTDPMAVLQGHRGVGFSKDPINVLPTGVNIWNQGNVCIFDVLRSLYCGNKVPGTTLM